MRSPDAVALIALVLFVGCGSGLPERQTDSTVLRLRGSDTMLMLGTRWAEEFMLEHPGVSVYVDGGGTSVGVAALLRGETDLCMASRPLTAAELNVMAEKHHSLGYSVLVARDALSFYVNAQNPVFNLSMQQLRGIFTGQITRWSEVGGADAPIVIIRRNASSGTHFFLEEHVLQGLPFIGTASVSATTASIVERVEGDINAIGYGGLAYTEGVRGVSVDWVSPLPEYVRGGTYPVARYLYLYALQAPTGITRTFVDWVLSERGQAVVQEVGYVPLYDLSSPLVEPLPR